MIAAEEREARESGHAIGIWVEKSVAGFDGDSVGIRIGIGIANDLEPIATGAFLRVVNQDAAGCREESRRIWQEAGTRGVVDPQIE